MVCPVFLVGMMGSGKTTVGRAVAGLAQASFCDLDRRIERLFGEPVAALVAAGEPELRAREHDALRSLVDEPGVRGRALVVATGGGTPIDPRNRALMRDCGVVVLLDVPLATLAARLHAAPGDRPLLHGDPAARLAALWAAREASYRDGSIAVDADAAIDEVAHRVLACWSAGERPWIPG